MDTEGVLIEEALVYHVDQNCVDLAFGAGSYEWLSTQVSSDKIGIDEDIYNLPEWDYARGYWIEEPIRFQYWGIPIFVAQQIVNEDEIEQLAITLVHELAHERGYTEDEGIAEAIGRICTHS